ncbi:YIR protein, partial [Plasmodium yoelii]
MDKNVCEKFQDVRNSLSDELSNGSYNFKDDTFLNDYCDSNQCQSYFDRISAGCLYLLYQFYNDSGIFPSPKINNPYIVDYILIWLSYMLNLGKSKEKDNINVFYSAQINSCDKYKTEINNLAGYDNYKELIDERKDLLNMDSNIVSKFYEALKSLCKLYNELDNNKNCEKYLDDNNEFFNKYEELKKDTSITDRSPYKEILFTLSTDYSNFKKECKNIISPPSEETKQNPGQISAQYVDNFGQDADIYGQDVDISGQYEDNSDVASSSSSILSKLIPVLLIFGAIPIFFGIS